MPFAALVLMAMTAVTVPATALAGPAVDEYTLDLPDAKGKVESPEVSPVANPATLPPRVVSRLAHNPSGRALATIATAGTLGAPTDVGNGKGSGGSAEVAGSQPSGLAAATSAVGDPAVIGVIVLLIVVGAGMFVARRKTPA